MKLTTALLTVAAATLSLSATAQEDAIRKALAERIPQMDKIDEVRPTPMKGLYEVRIGTDLFYTDAKGDYVIQGELIDSKARRNLTEDRINKLTAVNFSAESGLRMGYRKRYTVTLLICCKSRSKRLQ